MSGRMPMTLDERLNAILPKLVSDEFLQSRGLGNEIAFYIFDYPPEEELRVRERIDFVLERIPSLKPGMKVNHVNLLDLVLGYLEKRKLLDKSFERQKKNGDAALFKALEAPLHESRLAAAFTEAVAPEEHDLVMVSGVGSVWPLLRTHTLLNNLHPIMGQTPLVMFFPGHYDGQALRLFGTLRDDNYYRAFKLIP